MTGYIPYMVAPSTTGISTYLKPWLQPEDSLVDAQDCYVYRGVIQKRYGYGLLDTFPSSVGIYQMATADGRAPIIYTGTVPNATAPYPIGKRSLEISHTLAGVVITDGVDDGAGVISGTNIAAGTINYVTGAISITFTVTPDLNTGIRVDYGIRIGIGNGGAINFPINLNSVIAGVPVKKHSVFVKNTASNQYTPLSGDVPNSAGTTGNLANIPTGVAVGSVVYSTGVTSVTFIVPPPAAAADADVWARWQFQAPAEPIKGIKYFWTADGTQETLVFTNTQAAVIDSINRVLVNISGPNYFTTSASNFFSVANYQGKAWIVNNTDRLTVWDGTFLTQPIVATNSLAPLVNTINTALFVSIYKNRLNLFRPILSGTIKPQRAIYSALNNPFIWYDDVQGAGGFIEAPTPEWIISQEFLRDEIIAHFQDSTWKYRYTGVDNSPYRWEKLNDMRRIDAPYASVSYQDYETSLGETGLLMCDGVNVERYDEKIIDFTADNIDPNNYNLCNSWRFDNLNQQLICYPSKDGETADYCNKWLVWNYVEDSFCLFNIATTTFGAYFNQLDRAWEDFTAANNLDYAWKDFIEGQNWLSYFTQKGARIPIFGTKDSEVMEIMPFFATDNGTKTGFEFLTKDFNPFVGQGQRCTLGYVDFYFDRPSAPQDYDPDYLLNIDFYIDEQEVPALTVTLNPSEDDWQKKRVFVNINAQFHRFRVYLTDDQIANSTVATKGFTLNGYILWMQASGRISGI